MEYQNHYNIITSCDDTLAPYVAITLMTMAINLKNDEVNFYLLHSKVSRHNIELLEGLCRKLTNIKFREIIISNPEKYDELAKIGGNWGGEAYYSLCAFQLLPEEINRAMYIDAGDVLIVGDISPYYSSDFEGNSLIVTSSKYKVINGEREMFEPEDLGDWNNWAGYILEGVFNSGSYIMNLEKMRNDGLSMADYHYLSKELGKIYGGNGGKTYTGDQGLLSAAFVGDIKSYAFPQTRNIWYMPYNFCIWYYDHIQEKPPYKPSVIHYAGVPFKPWTGKYPIFLERFQKEEGLRLLDELKLGQAEYYYLWHEYAMMTDKILGEIGY